MPMIWVDRLRKIFRPDRRPDEITDQPLRTAIVGFVISTARGDDAAIDHSNAQVVKQRTTKVPVMLLPGLFFLFSHSFSN